MNHAPRITLPSTQGRRRTARLPPIENKAVPLKFVYNLPQLGIDRFDVLWLCSTPSPQELAKFGMRSEFKILLSLDNRHTHVGRALAKS